MRAQAFCIAGLAISTVLGGCNTPVVVRFLLPSSAQEYVPIALVDDMGIPPENVVNLLHCSGIDAVVEGSRVYGVSVPASQSSRAIKLLTADAKRRPYEYKSIEGYKGKLETPEQSRWAFRKLNIDFKDFKTAPELRKDTNLLGLALEARQMVDLPVKSHVRAFLSGARLFPMEYVDRSGETKSGYLGVVTVKYRDKPGEFEVLAYSWNNGADHIAHGGGGTVP